MLELKGASCKSTKSCFPRSLSSNGSIGEWESRRRPDESREPVPIHWMLLAQAKTPAFAEPAPVKTGE